MFGSSKGQSAQVAGAHGLPFVASYHITPATALDAIDAYRAAFRPSAALREPYVVVSADVVVADDTATARHLASSYGHWVYSIRAGDGAIPYPDPDTVDPLTDEQLAVVKDRTATQFVGDADEVASEAGDPAARDRAPTSWSSRPSRTGTRTGCAATSCWPSGGGMTARTAIARREGPQADPSGRPFPRRQQHDRVVGS